jgi:hypothetical protein
MRRYRTLGLLAATLLAGCIAVPPSPPVPGDPSASAALPSNTPAPTPRPTATIVPTDSPVPAGIGGTCPELSFDDAAQLPAVFDQEYFPGDESEVIARRFLTGLGRFYARPSEADVCTIFTRRGLETARILDARLAAVDRGDVTIDGELILRLRNEGQYDLRRRPPAVPLDVIFDIPAGARITNRISGEIVTTPATERLGFQLLLAFDGHRWLVDWVGPVSPSEAMWTRLPVPLPPAPPCRGFHRDPIGAPFDQDADRTWCDSHGAGRLIRQDDEIAVIVRYPCGAKGTIITIGRPLGSRLDPLVRWEYMRDPDGKFRENGWLAARYLAHAALPEDAVDTGWSNGNIDLWISPRDLDRAVYMVRGNVVERWARAAESWGVTDCN